MERFGVLTLVFLIAIVDFGHIVPSFAQTGDDDLISGTSGRSVRANVVGASWTWTAPATGPVTFDTRGSDFDVLLTVSDGVSHLPIASTLDLVNLTYSSELRFTAQQGQTYSITAARADGSFDPGTIVLNWGITSPVQPLRVAVFENPGPGKPHYVIAGQNASLQYWKTPGGAERPTHHDHGAARHGLGTTLSYVMAGTTDVLAEVEYLDYAMHNGRRVLVAFNDPPVPEDDPCYGMTHEYWDLKTGNWVACLRDGELLGELTPHSGFFQFPMIVGDKWTQVMSWRDHVHPEHSSNALFGHTYTVEECGIEVKVPAGEFTTCRVRFVEASYPDIVPETRWYDPDLDLVIRTDRDGAVYELWDYELNASPLRFGSTLYASVDGAQSVRLFYDEATGLPRQVFDEVSGNWMLIRENGAFVDFWLYDDDGNYQGGFSVFEESGHFYYAEIAGVPVHAGKELTGRLHPDADSWTGHFTLQVEWGDDLVNIQPVPREITVLMSNLAPLATDQQEGAFPGGGRPRHAAIQQPTTRADLIREMAALFTPSQVMAEEEKWEESTFSFSEGLTLVGMGLLGTGAIVAVGPWAAIAGSAGHLLMSGAAGIIGGEILRNQAEEARSWCGGVDGGDDVVARIREFCHMAVNHLAHKDDRGASGYLRDVLDWATKKPGRLRAKIEQGKQVLENAVNQLTLDDPLCSESEDPPISDDTPPPIDSPMSGQAERPNGIVEQLSGDIDPDGSFAAVGNGLEILGDVSEDGTSVAATFAWDGESGIAVGTLQTPAHDEFPLLGDAHYACPCGQWGEPRLNVDDPDDPYCTCGPDIRQELRICSYSDGDGHRIPSFCFEDDGNTGRWLVSDVEARIKERLAAIADEERRVLEGSELEQSETPPHAGAGDELIGQPHYACPVAHWEVFVRWEPPKDDGSGTSCTSKYKDDGLEVTRSVVPCSSFSAKGGSYENVYCYQNTVVVEPVVQGGTRITYTVERLACSGYQFRRNGVIMRECEKCEYGDCQCSSRCAE